jgi:hypothetical protein
MNIKEGWRKRNANMMISFPQRRTSKAHDIEKNQQADIRESKQVRETSHNKRRQEVIAKRKTERGR